MGHLIKQLKNMSYTKRFIRLTSYNQAMRVGKTL
jgi:hypothetical protein